MKSAGQRSGDQELKSAGPPSEGHTELMAILGCWAAKALCWAVEALWRRAAGSRESRHRLEPRFLVGEVLKTSQIPQETPGN